MPAAALAPEHQLMIDRLQKARMVVQDWREHLPILVDCKVTLPKIDVHRDLKAGWLKHVADVDVAFENCLLQLKTLRSSDFKHNNKFYENLAMQLCILQERFAQLEALTPKVDVKNFHGIFSKEHIALYSKLPDIQMDTLVRSWSHRDGLGELKTLADRSKQLSVAEKRAGALQILKKVQQQSNNSPEQQKWLDKHVAFLTRLARGQEVGPAPKDPAGVKRQRPSTQ